MNLEKREYMPEEYRDMYEDEIDLKELFLVLWRNKVKIMAVALICMILGFAAGKVMGLKSKKSTVVVEYTYPGIEEGKSPNGNVLGAAYNQLKNIFMIKDIYHKMPELATLNISEDNMLNGIKITPVMPEDLEKGKVYYPNKFTYSLKITGSSEMDEEVLRNFIEVQRDYFKRNYKLNNQLPMLDFTQSTPYDYNEMANVIGASLNTSIKAVNTLSDDMLINDDKIELQSILKELTILRYINLVKVKNMIEDYSVTKNPENLMISYRQQLEELNRAKSRSIGKIAQLEDMIKNYKPIEKDVVIMSNGNSETIKTDNENYYTEFLRQLAAEKIKLSDINVEIKYVNEKMKKEINSDNSKNEYVNKEFELITNKNNEKIAQINSLVLKNYNRKYAEIIKVSEDVTTTSNSKTLITTVAGLVLGGFLGVCYVLLGNFIFEEKKKNHQEKNK